MRTSSEHRISGGASCVPLSEPSPRAAAVRNGAPPPWELSLIAGLFASIHPDALRRFRFASGAPTTPANIAVVREVVDHSKRTARYVRILAGAAAASRRSTERSAISELFATAAVFHDVGKFAVPARILGKPGRLDTCQFEVIERHPLVGAHMIKNAAIGMPSIFIRCAREMAALHHERWDGHGYPFGLCGKQIPFVARLMAIADVYDALVHTRSYKPAFSHEDAKRIILAGRGTSFDPRLVDVFASVSDELARQPG